ncbi:MAG: type II toxin-antitoxin system VapC family toxin [Acidobacteria bacterium]|nr:type II toxin-antitoxin system VapC family toxin [Acidobacteriota bacterium]
MIIPDVNLLLYAELDAHPHHVKARRWWEDALNGTRQVGLPPVCLFGFLRLSTSRRVFVEPLTADDATARVERWMSRPNVSVLSTGRSQIDTALRLMRQIGVGGDLTTDIQIAAHALEMQAEVHSNDSDFARFEGLRWSNPLR